MTIMTEQEINERLRDIALAEDEKTKHKIEQLKHARGIIYQQMLGELDASILTMEKMPEILRENLKRDMMEHVAAGGDPKAHDCVKFKRDTTFQYDKKHALEYVKANDLPYTRTKIELDAVPFKKACQDGTIDYPDGETVNQPTVAIGKLGHLLIVSSK